MASVLCRFHLTKIPDIDQTHQSKSSILRKRDSEMCPIQVNKVCLAEARTSWSMYAAIITNPYMRTPRSSVRHTRVVHWCDEPSHGGWTWWSMVSDFGTTCDLFYQSTFCITWRWFEVVPEILDHFLHFLFQRRIGCRTRVIKIFSNFFQKIYTK